MSYSDKFWFAGMLWAMMSFYCSANDKQGPARLALLACAACFILGPFA